MDHQMKIRFIMLLELVLLQTTTAVAMMYLYYHFTVSCRQQTRRNRKRSWISAECTQPNKASSSRRKPVNNEAADIKNWMRELMESTRTAIVEITDKLLQAPPTPQPAAEQAGLYDALSALPELSTDDIFWATGYLANNCGDRLAFYGMPEQVRGKYVLLLLKKCRN